MTIDNLVLLENHVSDCNILVFCSIPNYPVWQKKFWEDCYRPRGLSYSLTPGRSDHPLFNLRQPKVRVDRQKRKKGIFRLKVYFDYKNRNTRIVGHRFMQYIMKYFQLIEFGR